MAIPQANPRDRRLSSQAYNAVVQQANASGTSIAEGMSRIHGVSVPDGKAEKEFPFRVTLFGNNMVKVRLGGLFTGSPSIQAAWLLDSYYTSTHGAADGWTADIWGLNTGATSETYRVTEFEASDYDDDDPSGGSHTTAADGIRTSYLMVGTYAKPSGDTAYAHVWKTNSLVRAGLEEDPSSGDSSSSSVQDVASDNVIIAEVDVFKDGNVAAVRQRRVGDVGSTGGGLPDGEFQYQVYQWGPGVVCDWLRFHT